MRYAKIDGAVRWSGGTTILHKGLSADDEHPLVAERPDLWTTEAPQADLRAPAGPRKTAPVVERATRAPGEVRKTARVRKANPAPAQPTTDE